jgi:hypothetical protein
MGMLVKDYVKKQKKISTRVKDITNCLEGVIMPKTGKPSSTHSTCRSDDEKDIITSTTSLHDGIAVETFRKGGLFVKGQRENNKDLKLNSYQNETSIFSGFDQNTFSRNLYKFNK